MIDAMATQGELYKPQSLDSAADKAMGTMADRVHRLLETAKDYMGREGMGHLTPALVVVGDEAQVHGAPMSGETFPVCGYKNNNIVYYC